MALPYSVSFILDNKTKDDEYKFAPHYKELLLYFQFLQYSIDYWMVHAGQVDDWDLLFLQDVAAFLTSDSIRFKLWRKLWHRGKSRQDGPSDLSPLHVSAHCGLTAHANFLLAKGNNENAVDEFERTLLAYAAMKGRSETVAVLLRYGARFDSADHDGLAPIHHAVEMNHAKVIELLAAAGASLTVSKSRSGYPSYTSGPDGTVGRTPLYYACHNGHVDALLELLKKHCTLRVRNWFSALGSRDG